MKLTRTEKDTYRKCLGKCSTCLLEGDCSLEDKLKKNGDST